VKDNNLSRLYREGAWPEPSRQIDQAILAASRRAAREERSFTRRWAPSFAVAATVVLTSVLVLKVVREQPAVVSPAGVEQQVTVTSSKQAVSTDAKVEEARTASAPTPAPPATPQGYSETMDAAEAARLDRLKRDIDLKQAGIPTESPSPAPVAKKESRSEAPQRSREQPAPISVFGATSAAPAPAPVQQAPRAIAAKPVAPLPPAARAEPSPPQAAPQPAQALSSSISAYKAPERTPQSWIEDIRKLMKEGKSEEAGAEIAEFKKRYPDFMLPEDLR
jgi:hypothetical protein